MSYPICRYCGKGHATNEICAEMFGAHTAPVMNIADETERTATVMCNQRSYIVPVDVANELTAERKRRERAEAELATVKEELRKLREYANEAYDLLRGDASCDHSVGICWCGYHALAEAAGMRRARQS